MNINNYEYFIFLGVCLLFPLLLTLFHPNLSLRKNIQPALKAIFLMCIPFWIWDSAVVVLGHWTFNPKFITGNYIVNLPIEEVLFFVVIPFCCLTIWAEIRAFTTWGNFWNKLLMKNKII